MSKRKRAREQPEAPPKKVDLSCTDGNLPISAFLAENTTVQQLQTGLFNSTPATSKVSELVAASRDDADKCEDLKSIVVPFEIHIIQQLFEFQSGLLENGSPWDKYSKQETWAKNFLTAIYLRDYNRLLKAAMWMDTQAFRFLLLEWLAEKVETRQHEEAEARQSKKGRRNSGTRDMVHEEVVQLPDCCREDLKSFLCLHRQDSNQRHARHFRSVLRKISRKHQRDPTNPSKAKKARMADGLDQGACAEA
eukprot:TRINITY_DN886_c0_g1_i4.p1 TRINITY_DN886_c0_g1~~TRINITY_DN886_c0_g1_i4.p1  ORF type:complete len:250 (-),score=38.64 TRINITY_DN886_c0_g1_i4:201-950(-)